jgi:hypothetical protein
MSVDPKIKTKVTIDPDTGARVFNQSWSSEIKKKEPIVRKPVGRDTFVTEKKIVSKTVVKPTAKETNVKTSGGRKFSEVVSPKPAKAVGMELKAKADIKERAPQSIKKEKIKVKAEMDDKGLLINNPGMKLEDIKRKIEKNKEASIRKSNRSVKDSGGLFSNEKNRSSSACQSGCR